jgi:hypothetical protein
MTTQADAEQVRRLALELPETKRAALGEALVAGMAAGILEVEPGHLELDGGRIMRAEVRQTVERILGGPW